jgi:23S rRNA (adenine2503-C2)-methyltransferase
MKQPLLDMSREELADWFTSIGQPAFRAEQVLQWVWQKQVYTFAAMSNLPAPCRDALDEQFAIFTSRVVSEQRADDDTLKLLLELHDAEQIETVLIPAGDRQTVCLSTQVGCAMRCGFCASGLGGLSRNLRADEILQQVLYLQRVAGRAVTNVVFMGIGEPLANYDATLRAVRTMIDPKRGGLSARKVTISTVGLPDAIRRLAGENLPVTLAISLHAPDDDLRARLMPAAAKVAPVADIIQAARAYYHSRKREVTLEYTLLGGVNDSMTCADHLAELAGQLRCNVNLIRYNPVPTLPYRRPDDATINAFAARLESRGVNVTVRRSRGQSCSSACGQLRQSHRQDHDNTA